jgi:hypothetical protein
MSRSYSMTGVRGPADRAVQLARSYLQFQDSTGRIHDVQDDPRFQQRGVDLLWERGHSPVLGVEVKGDRQAKRGNYFFELISNLERESPGCFLYSSADLLLYVFLSPRELHHLPMNATRQWFLARAKSFELRSTRTRVGRSSYTTVGALVPIKELLAQVPGASRFRVGAEGQIRAM